MKSKVAIIDYWSDYNRGDAMMQVAILQLVNRLPSTVILDSGCNEYKRFSAQLDETQKIGNVNFLPSPKLSFYFRAPGKIKNIINKLCLIANVFVFHLFFLVRSCRLDWLIPSSVKGFFDEIEAADVVIWNGRNFRSNNKSFEFFEYFDLCCAAICAIYMNKEVYALGVSIWTPKSALGLSLLRRVFSRCSMVYAREDVSLEVLKKEILPDNNELCGYLPDLSFFYMEKNLAETADLRPEGFFTIGIVPKDPVRRNKISLDEYAEFVVEIVKEVVKQQGNLPLRFKFINQAVLENEPNDEAVEFIGRQLRGVGEVIEPIRQPTLNDLSIAYRECDFVISSRMHGCILSAFFNRPFVGIPYDAGAKWGILERLGDCVLIPMEAIHSEGLSLPDEVARAKYYSPREQMCKETQNIISIVDAIVEGN
jgi:polysaccharide pyruvyl transferase WcaK-like protein